MSVPQSQISIEGSGGDLRIYRCSHCGKWSHAKKRPRWHERRIDEYNEDFDQSAVTRVEENGQEPETGAWLSVVYVRCGPFDAFLVTPEVSL